MEPNYRPGNLVVGIKTKKIKIGDAVVVQHKTLGKILKRVKSIDVITLQSDNEKYVPSQSMSFFHLIYYWKSFFKT